MYTAQEVGPDYKVCRENGYRQTFAPEHLGFMRIFLFCCLFQSFSDDSIEKHPHSPLLEKYSNPPTYHRFVNKVCLFVQILLLIMTSFQPFYPNMMANKTFESSAPLEDYIDGATLRIGDNRHSSPKEARSTPTEVQLQVSPS